MSERAREDAGGRGHKLTACWSEELTKGDGRRWSGMDCWEIARSMVRQKR